MQADFSSDFFVVFRAEMDSPSVKVRILLISGEEISISSAVKVLVIGIFGNLFVCVAVGSERKMGRPINVVLMNLVIVDLLAGVFYVSLLLMTKI